MGLCFDINKQHESPMANSPNISVTKLTSANKQFLIALGFKLKKSEHITTETERKRKKNE